MALQACFLPHFPRTLQGRAKTSESSRVARGLRQLRALALPDLAALLGGLRPAGFFAKAPDAQAKRERIYPPVTLFWAFLFQVLNPAMPCQEVVGKVRAWFISRRADTRRPALSTAAYRDQPRKLTHWQEELLAAIASVQNPQRPGRREPRARKRRPKKLPVAHQTTLQVLRGRLKSRIVGGV